MFIQSFFLSLKMAGVIETAALGICIFIQSLFSSYMASGIETVALGICMFIQSLFSAYVAGVIETEPPWEFACC